jgi:hypothetical protein
MAGMFTPSRWSAGSCSPGNLDAAIQCSSLP